MLSAESHQASSPKTRIVAGVDPQEAQHAFDEGRLPAAFLPNSPTTEPRGIARSTPRSTFLSPNRLHASWAEITASSAHGLCSLRTDWTTITICSSLSWSCLRTDHRLFDQRPEFLAAIGERAAGAGGPDPHPRAADPLDHPLRLQPGIGLGNGHHVHFQLRRQLPHAGQKFARRQPAAGNQGADLIHDLPIDRQARGRMNGESEGRVVHMCITIVMHIGTCQAGRSGFFSSLLVPTLCVGTRTTISFRH